MRFEDKELNAFRRKISWRIALVCGPTFAILVVSALWLMALIPGDNSQLFWVMMFGCVSAVAWISDRMGRKYKVMPQQFAGPVAFSCSTSLVLLIVCIYNLNPF